MWSEAETSDIISILEATPGNYLILKPDAPRFTIAAVTDKYAKLLKKKKEELVNRGIFEVFTSDPHNPEAKCVLNLKASLCYVLQYRQEHKMSPQQGNSFDPQTNTYEQKVWNPLNKPVLDDKGEVIYIIHSVEDVTEKVVLEVAGKKAKDEAEHQRRVLFNFFMQAPVAIAVLSSPGYIIDFANDVQAEIWGRKRENVIGKPVFEALPELKGQGYEELYDLVVKTGEQFDAKEYWTDLVRNGQKERVYFDFVLHPLKRSDGSVYSIITITQEVTEQVNARKTIEENNQDLETSQKKLEEFAYVASHDLQAPLRKIKTFTGFLAQSEQENLSDYGKATLSRIHRSADRMEQFIKDLFVLSKVSDYSDKCEEVSLNDLVSQVKEDLCLEISRSNATLIADNLPAIHGIRIQLYQLFQNLISNSIKYAKKEKAPVIIIQHQSITTSEKPLNGLRPCSTYNKLSFTDNGIGFNPEYSENIFKLFYRLNEKSEVSGTGIGLAICKKIAENHKGIITAEGTEGIGARFEVYLRCPNGE